LAAYAKWQKFFAFFSKKKTLFIARRGEAIQAGTQNLVCQPGLLRRGSQRRRERA